MGEMKGLERIDFWKREREAEEKDEGRADDDEEGSDDNGLESEFGLSEWARSDRREMGSMVAVCWFLFCSFGFWLVGSSNTEIARSEERRVGKECQP